RAQRRSRVPLRSPRCRLRVLAAARPPSTRTSDRRAHRHESRRSHDALRKRALHERGGEIMRIDPSALLRRVSIVAIGAVSLSVFAHPRSHKEAKAQPPSPSPIEPPPTYGDAAPIPPSSRWLQIGPEQHHAILFRPTLERDKPRPVVVMLHGMCDTPV